MLQQKVTQESHQHQALHVSMDPMVTEAREVLRAKAVSQSHFANAAREEATREIQKGPGEAQEGVEDPRAAAHHEALLEAQRTQSEAGRKWRGSEVRPCRKPTKKSSGSR